MGSQLHNGCGCPAGTQVPNGLGLQSEFSVFDGVMITSDDKYESGD